MNIFEEIGGAGAGSVDWVYSTVSHAISSGIERLFLQGADAVVGIGNSGDNEVFGSMADNRLSGRAGNDILETSGVGHDTLRGGSGDDRIRINDGDDCTASGGERFDRIELRAVCVLSDARKSEFAQVLGRILIHVKRKPL